MADTDLILAAKTTAEDPVRVDGEVGPLTTNLDGRLRVATKPGYFPPVSGALTASGNTLVVDVTDASNLILHIKNTGSAAMAAGAFVFEGSVDSTDGSDGAWFALQAIRSDSNTIENGRGTSSLAAGAGQAYAWELSVNAVRWFRVRCTTTLTNNAVATWTAIRGTYATEPVPAIQTHPVTQSGTWNVNATLNPGSVNAYQMVSTASTNGALLLAGSRALYEFSVFNPTAATVYVKLYNKSTAPTVGTDIPAITIPVATNQLVAFEFGSFGKRFPSGLGIAITAGPTASDATAVAAGVQLHGMYV